MIWDRLFKQAKEVRKIGFINNPWDTPTEMNLSGLLKAYGSVYSLFGITNRIATGVSEVRWRLYKGSERSERSQIADHPILRLLDFANEFQAGQEIMELHSICSDCAGKVFWYLPRNQFGLPAEIWILPPNRVKIVSSKTNFISGYVFQNGTDSVPISKDEIIYFPMPDPMNPYGGVSYAQAAAIELDSESYSGRWNRNFFFNSARADAVLESEGTLTVEQFERLKEQWEKRHGGVGRAHKIAILEGGIKYKQTQVMPKDMDFAQLRKQTRENLLFTFGMPLSVMGITENVNRANAEAGDYTFGRWLIKPRLNRIKNKLNEQLLPKFPTAKGMELDFDEVVPETLDQKISQAESGARSGILTINECRKLQGFDPLPNGDQLLIPLNMIMTPTRPHKSVAKSFTDEWKEAYWKIYVNKSAAMEQVFIEKLQSMFSSQENEVLTKLSSGKLDRKKPLDISESKKSFVELATPILTELLKDALSRANLLLNPEPEHRSKQSPAEIAALAWLKTRIGWAAKQTSEETASLLSAQLAEGFEAGESVPNMAKRVQSVFDGCRGSRALRIARTETIMASNEGALHGYEEAGVDKSEFYVAMDERTCEECDALSGRIFETREAHGMIPVHPNCRCVFLPVI